MIDIASIVFVCVSVNHLGLISAIEKRIGKHLIVLNCCKCLSFWATFTYSIIFHTPTIPTLAISFLAAYAAVWLELLMYRIDTLYLICYAKISKSGAAGHSATATNKRKHSKGSVPELQQQKTT